MLLRSNHYAQNHLKIFLLLGVNKALHWGGKKKRDLKCMYGSLLTQAGQVTLFEFERYLSKKWESQAGKNNKGGNGRKLNDGLQV